MVGKIRLLFIGRFVGDVFEVRIFDMVEQLGLLPWFHILSTILSAPDQNPDH